MASFPPKKKPSGHSLACSLSSQLVAQEATLISLEDSKAVFPKKKTLGAQVPGPGEGRGRLGTEVSRKLGFGVLWPLHQSGIQLSSQGGRKRGALSLLAGEAVASSLLSRLESNESSAAC